MQLLCSGDGITCFSVFKRNLALSLKGIVLSWAWQRLLGKVMIGGFIQGTLGRDWREDVKWERAGCCQETQPESHSMASWAETGTSALLMVTESTLSPITLSLCDTTEWGAELRKALGEPFLSTIQVSYTEDLSRNSFSSQQKPSQGSRWATHLIQNLLQTSHEALGSVPSDYMYFCMRSQVALGSSTLYPETSATFPRKWSHLFSQSLNQATLKVCGCPVQTTCLCPPFSQHEGKWVLLPLENLHFLSILTPSYLRTLAPMLTITKVSIFKKDY